MKRVITILNLILFITMGTSNLTAQNHETNTPRSEEFLLDSMRMEVEKMRIESESTMYADSLEVISEIEKEKIYCTEEYMVNSIPFTFFVAIIIIVWLSLLYSHRKQKNRYNIIEKALNMGVELPEGIFDEPRKKQKSWLNTLRTGVATACAGLGIMFMSLYVDNEILTGISFIPALIGVGYLLVAFLEYKEEKRTHVNNPHPTQPDVEPTDFRPDNNENNEENQ